MMDGSLPRTQQLVGSWLRRLRGSPTGTVEIDTNLALASARREVTRLQEELNHIMRRRQDGFLVELDYAASPRVREWSEAKGNNYCERKIASGVSRYRALLEASLAYVDYFGLISSTESADGRRN